MVCDPHSGVRGYVLAGGESTRFGRDKALVPFGDVPLLLRTVDLARTCTTSVSVVSAPRKYCDLDAQLEILEDRWPGQGPLGGIITALENTAEIVPGSTWNLILSCDMPFLTGDWLQFLVDRARHSSTDVQAIVPQSAHGLEPLCACYRTNAAEALKTAFEAGVRKVTQALKQVHSELLDESVWTRFDSAGRLFWNMNTPADFEGARRFWKPGPAR